MVGTAEQFRTVLETVKKEGHLLQKSGGGSAANAVNALSRMGFSTGFIGTVGNDEDGDFLIRSMGKVDCSHVKRASTTGAVISLVAEQDRSLILMPNANDDLSITEEDVEYANGFKVVHLSSFVSDSALREQVRLVRSLDSDVLVSFDPGEVYAGKGLDAIHSIIERSAVMFVNENELRSLTGQKGCGRRRGPYEDGAQDGGAEDGGGGLHGVLWWRQPFYPFQES